MSDNKIVQWGCNCEYATEVSLCLQLQKHATKAIRFGINSRNHTIVNDPTHAEYIATIFGVLNECYLISELPKEPGFWNHIEAKDDKWTSMHGEQPRGERLKLVLVTLVEELSEFIETIFTPTSTYIVAEEWAHCYWAYTKLIGLGVITQDEINNNLFVKLVSKYKI